MAGTAGDDAPDPIARFSAWLDEARASGLREPTACVVASVDEDGQPSARVVLLKRHDERGFVFFTNLDSRKGSELLASGRAALCFYWDALARQVRVRGVVEQVDDPDADAYFASRPRDSQIAAWASRQSAPLPDRAALEERVALVQERFGGEVPRPEHWSGLRVVPEEIELWTSGEHRLHVRDLYRRDEAGGWRHTLLFP
jgi:pyridoxamine 5'-phosphate oxidase